MEIVMYLTFSPTSQLGQLGKKSPRVNWAGPFWNWGARHKVYLPWVFRQVLSAALNGKKFDNPMVLTVFLSSLVFPSKTPLCSPTWWTIYVHLYQRPSHFGTFFYSSQSNHSLYLYQVCFPDPGNQFAVVLHREAFLFICILCLVLHVRAHYL